MVRDGASVQSTFAGGLLVDVAELAVDAQLVRHRTQVVPVLIDVHPPGLGVSLDLVADDTDPLRAVQKQQIRVLCFDLTAHARVRLADGLPRR